MKIVPAPLKAGKDYFEYFCLGGNTEVNMWFGQICFSMHGNITSIDQSSSNFLL